MNVKWAKFPSEGDTRGGAPPLPTVRYAVCSNVTKTVKYFELSKQQRCPVLIYRDMQSGKKENIEIGIQTVLPYQQTCLANTTKN